MSTTNNMNTRLFIDMDGTLAVWKQATYFEDLLQPGYFRDLPPYQTVLDAVKILCTTKPELDVYALSAYIPENQYAVSEKNAWLNAYLPEIDSEHRIFVACGSSKARAAANRLKTPCIDNSFVLLDDYSVNLHEWKANRAAALSSATASTATAGPGKVNLSLDSIPPKTLQTVFGVSSKNKCNELKEKYYVSKYQNCRSHPQRIPRWNAGSACQNG